MSEIIWEGEVTCRDGWPWIDSNKGMTDLDKAFREKLKDAEVVHVAFTRIESEQEGDE